MTTIEIERSTGLISSAAYKAMCYVATTAPVTLSGEQTIDGVVTDESRVLVKDQADSAQNGIYVTSTGDWSRAPDFSRNSQFAEGTRVWVTDGTTNSQIEYVVVSPDPIDIGTTDLDWQRAIDLAPTSDFASAIHSAVEVSVFQDADELGFWNSITTALGKITWANALTAIYSVLGERIAAKTAKVTPVDADTLIISDSAASNVAKKVTWSNIKATIFAAWGALINGATGKTTPIDADAFAMMDSAASNATKKLTWANLKATLKVYLDTLYQPVGSVSGPTLLTEQVTTSGTTKDFTIPAGAKRVTVMLNGVSTGDAADLIGIQLGDSGGVETTGYISGGSGTDRIVVWDNTGGAGGADTVSGVITLARMNATHRWAAGGGMGRSDTPGAVAVGGAKVLSAELTTVRLMGGTFDAGSVNVMWE